MGRPNVGKSTLLNRLLGEERSLVHDNPGTTRDPVNSFVTYENEKFILVDTAGIRKKGKTHESVEKFSIIKALQVLEKSHMVLLLLDAVAGISEQDAHVLGEAHKRGKAIIVLVNKWDEAGEKTTSQEFKLQLERKLQFVFYSPVLFISAKTGKGVDRLFPMILKVKKQYETQVSTSELNKLFEKIVGNHPLPVYGGKDIKIYYATQLKNRPPTFVVFANYPDKIHFSYERYLQNALRKALKLPLVPMRILFRKKK
jgi:GTP-binding protein